MKKRSKKLKNHNKINKRVNIKAKIEKRYKILMIIIFGLLSLGIGCFFTLNQNIFEQLKMQILTINSVLLLIITAITLYFII